MRDALRQGFATATDLADYLTRKGLPFRDAHEAVGLAVRRAEELGVDLPQLSLTELQTFSPLIGEDIFAVLTVEGSLASRNHIGGTAPEQVRAAIERARAAFGRLTPGHGQDREVRPDPRHRSRRDGDGLPGQ
jgi:argininosuccinate lyase